jgi:hypothetical protein
MARVLEAEENGVLLDLNGRRYWLSRGSGERPGASRLVPLNCELRMGQRVASRKITLTVDGRTVQQVGDALWSAVVNSPDPSTFSSAYDWVPDDVRVNGTIIPGTALPNRELPVDDGVRRQGKQIVLDHVTVRDLMELRLKVAIKRADLTVDLPEVIPDPKLTPSALTAEDWD